MPHPVPRPPVVAPSRRIAAAFRPAPDVSELWRRAPSSGVGGTYLLIACWAAAMAVILAVGPASRWSGPGFATIRDTGGPHVWAVLWAAGCVALIAGRSLGARWAARALWVNAFLCALWAISLAVPPTQNESTSWSGFITYTVIGVLCVLKADVHAEQAVSYPARVATNAMLVATLEERVAAYVRAEPADGGGP